MKLLITVDTEEDDAWSGRGPIATENVTYLPRLQDLCDRYAYPPTYLTNEPMAADPRFAKPLGAAVREGRAEVGIHLHPWSSRPFPGATPPDPSVQTFPHELAIESFREKVARIASLLREAFDVEPRSYRAGRWGFAAPQIPVLLDLGVRVDCSVTPHVSWKRHRGAPEGNGGPDFRGAPHLPYWLDPADVRRPGDSPLLELPMTVFYTRGPLARIPEAWEVVDRLRGGAGGPILRRIGVAPRMFRPWPRSTLPRLLSMVEIAGRMDLPYVMLMFHSSELMPGGSPYFPDAASVERLHHLLEALFAALREAGVEGSTLSAYAEPYFDGRATALGRGGGARASSAGGALDARAGSGAGPSGDGAPPSQSAAGNRA